MEGILTVLNRDPASGHGSQRIYILNADDGRRFELELAKPGSATGMDGKRVRATAATSWPVPATGAAARTRVLDIQAIDTQPRRDR